MLLYFLSLLILIVSLLITWEYLSVLFIPLSRSENRGQVWIVTERFCFVFFFLIFSVLLSAHSKWWMKLLESFGIATRRRVLCLLLSCISQVLHLKPVAWKLIKNWNSFLQIYIYRGWESRMMEDQVLVSLSSLILLLFSPLFFISIFNHTANFLWSTVVVLLGVFVAACILRFQISLQKKRCKCSYCCSTAGKTRFWS